MVLQERKDAKESQDSLEAQVLEVHTIIFSNKEDLTHYLSVTQPRLNSAVSVRCEWSPRSQRSAWSSGYSR